MSFPKGGKVKMTTPQSVNGAPKIGKMGSGSVNPGPAKNTIKKLIQQGTKHAQLGEKSSHPRPSAATKPDQSGTKIKTKIQTGTKASHSK